MLPKFQVLTNQVMWLLKCVLCGCRKSDLIQKGVRHAPKAEVRRCLECKLVFLLPRPNEKDLRHYYGELYRKEYNDSTIQERYRDDLDEGRIRVRRLLPYLRSEMSVLEIGCGSGAFLDAAFPYINEVRGVEQETAAKKWINKLGYDVVEDIGKIIREKRKFDLVVMFHFLEHIPNPLVFLKKISSLLKRKGTLIIEVPNIEDALISLYRIPEFLHFYYQKAHLYYFSRHTLKRLLEKSGFEASIDGVQRYDLSNHLRWMLTGKPGGQGYYDKFLSSPVHTTYADALIQSNLADTLWAVARRR